MIWLIDGISINSNQSLMVWSSGNSQAKKHSALFFVRKKLLTCNIFIRSWERSQGIFDAALSPHFVHFFLNLTKNSLFLHGVMFCSFLLPRFWAPIFFMLRKESLSSVYSVSMHNLVSVYLLSILVSMKSLSSAYFVSTFCPFRDYSMSI